MAQNLVWATGYSVIAIRLAAGIGIPGGQLLTRAVGAALRSLSTVVAALNTSMLGRESERRLAALKRGWRLLVRGCGARHLPMAQPRFRLQGADGATISHPCCGFCAWAS